MGQKGAFLAMLYMRSMCINASFTSLKGLSIICHGVKVKHKAESKRVWEMLGQSKSSKIL